MTKRYDEYKDSGVEWLGRIPKNWILTRIKNVVKQKTDTKNELIENEFFVPLEGVEKFTGKVIKTNKTLDNSNNAFIKGDVCINKLRPYLNKVINPDFSGACSNEMVVLRSSSNCLNSRYLFYYTLNSKYIMDLNNLVSGVKMPRLSPNEIMNSMISVPEKVEQQAIATYLDNKTSKIDSALSELTKQKDLLIELKKSTIHQAVTKGLDSTVEMKDSGVEWIGEVPSHWSVNSLKNFVNYKTGNTPDSNNQEFYSESGFEWANISDVGDKILPITKKRLSQKGVDSKSLKLVEKNSLLYSFKLSVGLCSIVDRPVYTNEAIAAFKGNNKVYVDFLYYSLGSHFYKNAKENIYGAPLLNRTLIENGSYVAPKKKEQIEIATFLDKKTGQIDQSIEVIDNQILQMKEYKKTLINDVVTGKIKVID